MQREIGAEMWWKAPPRFPDRLQDCKGMAGLLPSRLEGNGHQKKISRARMSLIIAEPQVSREILETKVSIFHHICESSKFQ